MSDPGWNQVRVGALSPEHPLLLFLTIPPPTPLSRALSSPLWGHLPPWHLPWEASPAPPFGPSALSITSWCSQRLYHKNSHNNCLKTILSGIISIVCYQRSFSEHVEHRECIEIKSHYSGGKKDFLVLFLDCFMLILFSQCDFKAL